MRPDSSSSRPAFADLAGLPLFAPLADWLGRFPGREFPPLESLNALAAGLQTVDGRPLRFVAPPDDGLGYEARIAASGEVEHRPDNGHDFFNALVWLAYPRAKAALSGRHGEVLAAASSGGRGAVRDALTQFDECGVVVVSCEPGLLGLLKAHRWKEAFWQRRSTVQACMAFHVFGHALYDQLHAPFFGLCGKAWHVEVERDWLTMPMAEQRADLDARLALWLRDGLASPRDLKPLPLLGIPGLTQENEMESYYDDTRQFRPARREAG